jgi:hypothetical protein
MKTKKTKTTKEERAGLKQRCGKGLCSENLSDYCAPLMSVDIVMRLLADADRCAELEDELAAKAIHLDDAENDARCKKDRVAELEAENKRLRQSQTCVSCESLICPPMQCGSCIESSAPAKGMPERPATEVLRQRVTELEDFLQQSKDDYQVALRETEKLKAGLVEKLREALDELNSVTVLPPPGYGKTLLSNVSRLLTEALARVDHG